MTTNEVNVKEGYTQQSNIHDRPQRIVHIENLANDKQAMYMNITPIDALINDYMIGNKKASQLHNTVERDKARALIVSGNKTFSIGDLCVLKFGA